MKSESVVKTQMNESNIVLQNGIQSANINVTELNDEIEPLRKQILNMAEAHDEAMECGSCYADTVESLKSLITKEMNVLTNDAKARIRLECVKMKTEIMEMLTDKNEQSARRKNSSNQTSISNEHEEYKCHYGGYFAANVCESQTTK